jgi:hypothetical protein
MHAADLVARIIKAATGIELEFPRGWTRINDIYATPEIRQYLLPRETPALFLRKHPGIMLRPAGLLLADLAMIGISAEGIMPQMGLFLGVTCSAIVPLLYYWSATIRAWRKSYIVVTNKRLIIIRWQRREGIASVPLAQVNDMASMRTLPAQLAGYGSLIIRMRDNSHTIRKIKHIPYPEQVYLEIMGIILPDDSIAVHEA